jgi:hypothetical protein
MIFRGYGQHAPGALPRGYKLLQRHRDDGIFGYVKVYSGIGIHKVTLHGEPTIPILAIELLCDVFTEILG